jgi:hypothetical protein
MSTFSGQTTSSITSLVTLNGNPAGTTIKLYIVQDSGSNTPGTPWIDKGNKTSGYSWACSGLSAGTTYWFKACAINGDTVYTNNTSYTSSATVTAAPTGFAVDTTTTRACAQAN